MPQGALGILSQCAGAGWPSLSLKRLEGRADQERGGLRGARAGEEAGLLVLLLRACSRQHCELIPLKSIQIQVGAADIFTADKRNILCKDHPGSM